MTHYKNILVPLDGSQFSEAVLDHAVPIAKAFGAALHLVRSMSFAPYLPPGVTYFGALPLHAPVGVNPAEQKQRDEERAEEYLKEIKSRLTREGVRCHTVVRFGLAVDNLLEETEKCKADLLVVASHQRTGLSRILVPNTSTKLSISTDCPVLVVPGDESVSPYQEAHLHERLCQKVKPHDDLLAEASSVDIDLVRAATPKAIAMILSALAEDRVHGPDLKQIIDQLRFYEKGAYDVEDFLSEGHSGPDLGLVAHVFHERGAKAASALSEEVRGLASDGALALLAFLAPIVLAELSAIADDTSELKQLLLDEIAQTQGEVQAAAEKAAEVVNSL